MSFLGYSKVIPYSKFENFRIIILGSFVYSYAADKQTDKQTNKQTDSKMLSTSQRPTKPAWVITGTVSDQQNSTFRLAKFAQQCLQYPTRHTIRAVIERV